MKKRARNSKRADRHNDNLLAGATAERLEDRKMLAGNVIATINGAGDLIVNGDGESNGVFIKIDQTGSVVEITGSAASSSIGETTVDGSGLVGKKVTRNVVVYLRGGNDRLHIRGPNPFVRIPVNDVRVFGGIGDDSLLVESMAISGDVNINTGPGNDAGDLLYANIDGKVTITGGTGNDFSTVAGNLADEFDIKMGSGNDQVLFVGTEVNQELKISLGSGDNQLTMDGSADGLTVNAFGGGSNYIYLGQFEANNEQVTIGTGSGDDYIEIVELLDVGKLKVSTGGGDDFARIEEVHAQEKSLFILGVGNDELTFNDYQQEDQTYINSGSGDDIVLSNDSWLGFSTIKMGTGNDRLRLLFTTAFGSANGNAGYDLFTSDPLNADRPSLDLKNFEERGIVVVDF